MLTKSYSKLRIELFCEINVWKLFGAIPFVCHCKHSNTIPRCTSSLSWVAPVHSACRWWPTQMGDALNIWTGVLRKYFTSMNVTFGCKRQWYDIKSRGCKIISIWSCNYIITLSVLYNSWDQMEDIFTQASILAETHSFRRIYFNLVSNVQTKPAIILTMARVCVRIGFSWLFL